MGQKRGEGGGGIAACTRVINLSVETESRTCCPWLVFERKKKEVVDLTRMHGMSGLHMQNDNKIVYLLATVKG